MQILCYYVRALGIGEEQKGYDLVKIQLRYPAKSYSLVYLLTVRVNLDAIHRFCYTGEMNEALTILTERVDDIPLLLAQMQRMGIARLLDAHFPTHGNCEGLSLGMVTII